MKPAPPVTQTFETMISSFVPSDAVAVGRAFYQRPTETVARELVGKLLIRSSGDGDVALRLTEVEAYLGPSDRASHTWGSRTTARNHSMWGPPGHVYVYLIYGLHHCANLVTAEQGRGEAVLLRGGIPVLGRELVRTRRGLGVGEKSLCDGPGKLCQALAIDRSDDGVDLCARGALLRVLDDGVRPVEGSVLRTARIGVQSAGEAAGWPLRFLWRGERAG